MLIPLFHINLNVQLGSATRMSTMHTFDSPCFTQTHQRQDNWVKGEDGLCHEWQGKHSLDLDEKGCKRCDE
jgi:hypothetical protein